MTSAPRYQSRSSMYIRGLIPWNWQRQFRLNLDCDCCISCYHLLVVTCYSWANLLVSLVTPATIYLFYLLLLFPFTCYFCSHLRVLLVTSAPIYLFYLLLLLPFTCFTCYSCYHLLVLLVTPAPIYLFYLLLLLPFTCFTCYLCSHLLVLLVTPATIYLFLRWDQLFYSFFAQAMFACRLQLRLILLSVFALS